MRFMEASSWSRSSPMGTTRTETSVTPASAKERKPLLDAGLAAGRQDVADVVRVAQVEQALVVGRHLGFGEDAVGAGDRDLDLVVAAEADRDAGDDAGRRPAGRARPRV